MTRYRLRVVLLLFGVLHLTACSTWQSVGPVSPSQFIEAEQPDRVRVTVRDGTESVLEEPSVEGDELVGSVEEASVRVPFGDIFRFEVRRFSTVRTLGAVVGGAVLTTVAIYALVFYGMTR